MRKHAFSVLTGKDGGDDYNGIDIDFKTEFANNSNVI